MLITLHKILRPSNKIVELYSTEIEKFSNNWVCIALSSNGGVMPKCSNVIFKIWTDTTKTINNKFHCQMESYLAFLISQILYGSASLVDIFSSSFMEKDYRVMQKRQHTNVNDRHRGLLQSDGHFLIQPASYLQCGRAAHPANLSFRFVWSTSNPSTRPLY